MKGWTLAAVGCALLLGACQSTNTLMNFTGPPGPPPWVQYVCNQVGPGHCAKLTVSGSTLSTDTPTMTFHVRDGRSFALWWIETEGYAFVNDPPNGPIRFKSDTQGQFDVKSGCYRFFNGYIPDNGRVFVCANGVTRHGQFPYGITVTPNDGSAPVTLDPMIVND